LTRLLTLQGIEAVAAASADEALGLLRQARKNGCSFGVALLDYRMPGCDGVELCRKITTDPQLHATRLVLLTSPRHSPQTADALGIAAQLVKPVSRRDLHDCLQLIWAGRPEDWHTQSLPTITQRELRAVRGRQHRHILVVDDATNGRKVMVRTLERLGYHASGVANGREAVNAWKGRAFHLVLMDCEMPIMDGFEATREIRRLEVGDQHIPIIALTGRTTQDASVECIEAGMDDFLIKPIDREGLEAALARHFGESLDSTAEPAQLLTAALAHDDEAPIDLTMFYAKVVDGDTAFGEELIVDFIQQAETAIREIATVAGERNTAELARIAHGLKTAAAAMEFQTIFTAVNRLESAARSGGEEVFTSIAPRVRHLLTRAVEFLRAEQTRTAA
jgi:CheY-like chemotaxis protein